MKTEEFKTVIKAYIEGNLHEYGAAGINTDIMAEQILQFAEAYHEAKKAECLPEVRKTMTAEEVLKQVLTIEAMRVNNADYTFNKVIEAMEKYVSQFPQDVTDEEIDSEVRKLPYTKHLDDGQFNDGQMSGFEQGARWMRNRMKGKEQ